MSGFIDIHTHILPGIDDGAKDILEARQMIRMAWEDGTRGIILTPHYRGVYKENKPSWLRESFAMLNEMVEGEFPGMELYLGNEIYYEADAPESLAAGQILTMNDSQYALLEFGAASLRFQVINGVSEMVRCGFTPIIAHAERYEVFRTDEDLANEVLDMGALIQVNAESIMGKQGLAVKRCCHRLLWEEKVDFVASDAHRADWRQPLLGECWKRVKKKYGEEYADRIFRENARAVIENRTV